MLWLQILNLPALLQNKNTRIGPFPWKRSVLQNPDRERTNQSTGIRLGLGLPYNNGFFLFSRILQTLHNQDRCLNIHAVELNFMKKSCLNAKTMLINFINLPCKKTLNSSSNISKCSISSSSRFFVSFWVSHLCSSSAYKYNISK